MEKIFKVKYWDYSKQRFQFQGYICLRSSLCWGFLGLILTCLLYTSRLRDAGWEITEDMTEADVGVVNTCGFIEAAKTEAIETILETAQNKQTGNMKGLVAVSYTHLCSGSKSRCVYFSSISFIFGI